MARIMINGKDYSGTGLDIQNITQAQYDNLTEGQKQQEVIYNIIDAGQYAIVASDVGYKSGTVADALDKSVMFPDYSNPIELHREVTTSSSNITFNGVADEDMYIQCRVVTDTASGLPFMRVILSSITVYEISKYGNAGGVNYTYRWSPMFPIKKGTPYSFLLGGGVSGCTCLVYKYKIA